MIQAAPDSQPHSGAVNQLTEADRPVSPNHRCSVCISFGSNQGGYSVMVLSVIGGNMKKGGDAEELYLGFFVDAITLRFARCTFSVQLRPFAILNAGRGTQTSSPCVSNGGLPNCLLSLPGLVGRYVTSSFFRLKYAPKHRSCQECGAENDQRNTLLASLPARREERSFRFDRHGTETQLLP